MHSCRPCFTTTTALLATLVLGGCVSKDRVQAVSAEAAPDQAHLPTLRATTGTIDWDADTRHAITQEAA